MFQYEVLDLVGNLRESVRVTFWQMKMTPMSSLCDIVLKAVIMSCLWVSLSTMKKFTCPALFFSPIPVSKNPVTVAYFWVAFMSSYLVTYHCRQ